MIDTLTRYLSGVASERDRAALRIVGLAAIQALVVAFQSKLGGGNFDSTKGANG